jgi:WD40 repeat protein
MYDTRVADGGRLSLSDPALGSSVLSVRFHAKHSHLLLLGGDAGTVCVWDIRSNAKCVAPVHTGGVFAAATLSDAPRSVFTVGGDGWLRQVEVEDGPSVRVHARLEDHLPLCAVTAFMEPDHRSVTVVAGGDSGTVHTITL